MKFFGLRRGIGLLATAVLMVLGFLFQSDSAHGQTQNGIGFLKLSPGARQFGMASSGTGVLDFSDSFYLNPGASGFHRAWQWSVSYTNWISDLYNASFLYGLQLRTPWSRNTHFALAANYLGIPDFDSSEGANPSASGSDLLINASIGQPVDVLTENLSFGINVKYYRGELANFKADAAIFDFGLLYRTPRFRFLRSESGFLNHAILSAGLAVTNVGPSITYVSEGTPLPRTVRLGLGLNLGSHDGLQWSFATDYRRVRSAEGFFTIGSEVGWSQLVSLRLGYSFEDNVLGQFSFGASLRLDDQIVPFYQVLPGRNNAVRFDLAANQSSVLALSPFHGTVSHFPIGPEGFRLLHPLPDAEVAADTLTLIWEDSRDPDLFDEINYWLLLDQERSKLEEIISLADQSSVRLFSTLSRNGTFALNQQQSRFELPKPQGGNFYWMVFAYDTDGHVRFADLDGRNIGQFRVAQPVLEITEIEFQHSPWITQDDYQGVLEITISNASQLTARNVSLAVLDSSAMRLVDGVSHGGIADDSESLIANQFIGEIPPKGKKQIAVEWRTERSGAHEIVGRVYQISGNGVADQLMTSNRATFYTIPKGAFATYDTVLTQSVTSINYELPYVGKVFFDSSRSEIRPRFVRRSVIEPLLVTLAKRLRDKPSLRIQLQGTADPNSGETDVALADARAAAVRDSLMALGVKPEQIELLAGEMLTVRRLPRDPEDARWLLQERRRVDILVDEASQNELFKPLQEAFSERVLAPVAFSALIEGVVPLESGFVQIDSEDLMESFNISEYFHGSGVKETIYWQFRETEINTDRDWQNTDANYSIVLTDSLSRRFATRPRQVFLKTTSVRRERMYFGVAKFALAEPLYGFYWDNLLDRVPDLLEKPNARMRFIGHACAIGPDPVNQRLSQQRAQLFYERFLSDAKRVYPDSYDEIRKRLDPPEAFGESRPFTFKGPKGEIILLGDNNLPTGRVLNRRVIALIYSEESN